MLTAEERALLLETQGRLIDLLVQQDEARQAHNGDCVDALQRKIADAMSYRDEIRCSPPPKTS
jgi:hypothetical protein